MPSCASSSYSSSKRPRPPADGVASGWELKELKGHDLPFMNSLTGEAIDYVQGIVYTYGGNPPGSSEENVPTSDLHAFDVGKKQFQNLTESLTFRTYGAFAEEDRFPQRLKLPALAEPGFTFLRLHLNGDISCPLLFLFGGSEVVNQKLMPSSKLFAIDPESKEWWEVSITGPVVRPRVNPAMAAAKNRIFIFGGFGNYKNPNDDSDIPEHMYSYSVAEFSQDTKAWTWIVADAPYPRDDVLPGSLFGAASALSDGKRIILGPGRKPTAGLFFENPKFDKKSIYYFDPKALDFEAAVAKGLLPVGVEFYRIFQFKRAREDADAPPLFSDPIFIMCTWNYHGDHDLLPELWLYHPVPENCFSHLELNDKFRELGTEDTDLPRFYIIGDKMLWLGNDGTPANQKQKRVNCYVEVPLAPLLSKFEGRFEA